jgi:uncharacterized protein YeeX (DUF496 family)
LYYHAQHIEFGDEGHVDTDKRFDNGGENVELGHGQATRTLQEFIDEHKRIRDPETRVQLKEDLIEYLWNHHPDLYSYKV